MATYYWVGGTGSWNTVATTNWAVSSGGSGGNGPPTSADTVVFDQNSNTSTNAFTVTVTSPGANCLNFTTSNLDGVMTLAGTFPLNVYGNLTYPSDNFTATRTGAINFLGTSIANTITTNGKTILGNITFNGIGGTFVFQDALTQVSTRAFTITNGTVQLKNGVTSTVGSFATSGTNQKFLQSTTPGSQATLSQASGTVNASYLTIKDISATGGATWNALWSNNNVDAGGNSGWVFGNQPIINAVEYTYQIRSFTQPRRF